MTTDLTAPFKSQHWLAAHNAWNTEIAPNQCKTITQLLNYGVRGFALDIYGDDEASLHLQHGHGNISSRTMWSVVHKELDNWLTANPNEVVCLFFESYLTGPEPGHSLQKSPLRALSTSLKKIKCYKAGKTVQQNAIKSTQTLQALVNKKHRLFAFIEKEPDEGQQSIFPVMTTSFAENVYGDASLKTGSWVNLRDGSSTSNALTFMNHFGDAPSGSEWDRNKTSLIIKHAEAFYPQFGNRYPNFVSLDYINWDAKRPGPIEAIQKLHNRPAPR